MEAPNLKQELKIFNYVKRYSGNKAQIFYYIQVDYKSKKYRLEKTYPQFLEFHKSMKIFYKEIPNIPTKQLFKKYSMSDMKIFVDLLNEYLTSLLEVQGVVNSIHIKHFFELDLRFKRNKASTPIKFGDIPQLNSPITDFIYLPKSKELYIGMKNPSLKSKLASAIVKIRSKGAERIKVKGIEAHTKVTESAIGYVMKFQIMKNNEYNQILFETKWKMHINNSVEVLCYCDKEGILGIGLGGGCIAYFYTNPPAQEERKIGEEHLTESAIPCKEDDSERSTLPFAFDELDSDKDQSRAGTSFTYKEYWIQKGHRKAINGLVYSREQNWVISISIDQYVKVTNIQTKTVISEIKLASIPSALCFDDRTLRILISTRNGEVNIVTDFEGKFTFLGAIPIKTHDGKPVAIKGMYTDFAARYIFVCCNTGLIVVFELGKVGHERFTKQIAHFVGAYDSSCIFWRPKYQRLYVGDKRGVLTIWDNEQAIAIFGAGLHTKTITQMQWVEGESLLLTAGMDSSFNVWKLSNLHPFGNQEIEIIEQEEEEKEEFKEEE